MKPVVFVWAAASLLLGSLLAGCDQASTPLPAIPAQSITAFRATSAPGTYTVPASVSAADLRASEEDARLRSCSNAPPMRLPAGTVVRLFERNGRTVLTFKAPRPAGAAPVRLGGAAGMVSRAGGDDPVTFTCRASSSEQNPDRGCTSAFDPQSGHVYCLPNGNGSQCTPTISTELGEGG